ncbi:MAG: AsmA-like C-terminal region-containing protein [Xanthobacteraceae bacterium]
MTFKSAALARISGPGAAGTGALRLQATLLGLGIALILALVAALVGPHFVDWSQYRSVFETNVTRLVGLPIRVNGTIEAQLLPTPSLVLRNIEGGGGGSGSDAKLKAGEVAVELALGPLLRGEWRATELRLVRPEFALNLDAAGRLEWPGSPPRIDRDALSIDRISIEDGRATLSDQASASSLVLDQFWFNGDVRSLAGPLKGEGGFSVGGERYGYRLATGRMGEDGLKLKLNLDPSERAAVEADGMLRVAGGVPEFEGTLAVGRPAGVVLARGRAVSSEAWRLSTRAKLGPGGGLLDQIEVQYGTDERAIKLTGTAQVRFGQAPRIDGIVSARQVDLDRAFVLPEGMRRVPLAVLHRVSDVFGGMAAAPIPLRFGVGIDTVTLAGATLQTVHADLASDGEAWNLEALEFRAPGLTQIRTSARVQPAADGATFTGPAVIESNDPHTLLGWIEGRNDARPGQAGALRASGDLTIGSDRIAVERLKAEIDRKAIAGRFAYSWAAATRPARLDAELSAAAIDVDQAVTFTRAALAGTTLDVPAEMTLSLDVGAASVAGVQAKDVHAKLTFDANGLVLQRVAVADLGGAALDLNGRIDSVLTSPRGTLTLDIDARRLDGLAAVLAKYVPQMEDPVRALVPRFAPAKLGALLTVERAESGSGSKAELVVTGKAGAARLNVTATASGEVSQAAAAEVGLNARAYADDGAALVALMGLDKAVAVDKRPAAMSATVTGRLNELRLDTRLVAGRLEAGATGVARLSAEDGVAVDVDLKFAAADALVLRRAGSGDPVPVTAKTRVKIKNNTVTFDDLSAVVAGSGVRGRVDLALGQPLRVDGRVETEALDLLALANAAAGMPARVPGRSDAAWLAEPFSPGALVDLTGQIAFAAQRATLSSAPVAQQVRGLIRFGKDEVSFEDIEAGIAGGRLLGQLALRSGPDGIAAHTRLAITDADAVSIFPSDARPAVTGRFGLQMEADGSGRTPAALVGSLRGAGTVTLERAHIAGLDAAAFDVVIRAVDRGLTVDAAKIRDMMDAALQAGRLSIARADGAFSISAGQARWGSVVASAQGADLTFSGLVDLAAWALDARLILSSSAGASGVAAGRPDVFIALKGPLTKPSRTVDASAFTGWLTLRAVERQSKQLEALESERQAATVATTPPVAGPVPPAAPAAPSAPAAVRVTPPEAEPQASGRTPETPTPPAPPAPPRRALAPSAASPAAPALPPPVEIRPLPEPRSDYNVIQRPADAGSATGAPKPRVNNSTRPSSPPPPDLPPAAARRSVLDQLFGPQR